MPEMNPPNEPIPPIPPFSPTPGPERVASQPAQGPPPRPTTPPPPAWTAPAPKRPGPLRRLVSYLGAVVVVLSIVVNIYLAMAVAALSGEAMGQRLLRKGQEDQVVAVCEIVGTIDGEAMKAFEGFYRKVKDNPNIQAIVINVNSPGGGVAASDEICMMIRSLREDSGKTVVISMGAVAASGGYYISAPADLIYAEPATITGSIGVVMAWPVVKGFFDKHGVNMMVIRSSQAQRYKAAVNPFEPPDAEILRETQERLDAVHEQFVAAVRDGRGDKLKTRKVRVSVMGLDGKAETREQIEPLNGRVFLAAEAKDLGLIDHIGYLDDAIDAAVRRANLDEPHVVRYAPSKTLRERLGFSDLPKGVDVKALEKHLIPRMMMLWQGR